MTNKKLEKLEGIKARKADLEAQVDEVLEELNALEGDELAEALERFPGGFAERDEESQREVLREAIRRYNAEQKLVDETNRERYAAYLAEGPAEDEALSFDDWLEANTTEEDDVNDENTQPGEQPDGIDVTAAGPSGDGDTAHEQAAPFAETKLAAAEVSEDLEEHREGDGQTGNENVNVDSPAEHANQPTAGEVDVPQDPAVSDVVDPHPDIAPVDDKPEAVAEAIAASDVLPAPDIQTVEDVAAAKGKDGS